MTYWTQDGFGDDARPIFGAVRKPGRGPDWMRERPLETRHEHHATPPTFTSVQLLIYLLSDCQQRHELTRDFELVAGLETVGTHEQITFKHVNVHRWIAFH